jgi:hypothetical protein
MAVASRSRADSDGLDDGVDPVAGLFGVAPALENEESAAFARQGSVRVPGEGVRQIARGKFQDAGKPHEHLETAAGVQRAGEHQVAAAGTQFVHGHSQRGKGGCRSGVHRAGGSRQAESARALSGQRVAETAAQVVRAHRGQSAPHGLADLLELCFGGGWEQTLQERDGLVDNQSVLDPVRGSGVDRGGVPDADAAAVRRNGRRGPESRIRQGLGGELHCQERVRVCAGQGFRRDSESGRLEGEMVAQESAAQGVEAVETGRGCVQDAQGCRVGMVADGRPVLQDPAPVGGDVRGSREPAGDADDDNVVWREGGHVQGPVVGEQGSVSRDQQTVNSQQRPRSLL